LLYDTNYHFINPKIERGKNNEQNSQ